MAIKKITIHFQMSDEVIDGLRTEYPNIIKHVEREMAKTTLILDVTPPQEAQIVPTLKDKMITIHNAVWPPL